MKEVIYLESVFHFLFCRHFKLLIKDLNYLFCNKKSNFCYLLIIKFNSFIVYIKDILFIGSEYIFLFTLNKILINTSTCIH